MACSVAEEGIPSVYGIFSFTPPRAECPCAEIITLWQPEFHLQVSTLTLIIPTAWSFWAIDQVPLEKGKLGDYEKPTS